MVPGGDRERSSGAPYRAGSLDTVIMGADADAGPERLKLLGPEPGSSIAAGNADNEPLYAVDT